MDTAKRVSLIERLSTLRGVGGNNECDWIKRKNKNKVLRKYTTTSTFQRNLWHQEARSEKREKGIKLGSCERGFTTQKSVRNKM